MYHFHLKLETLKTKLDTFQIKSSTIGTFDAFEIDLNSSK